MIKKYSIAIDGPSGAGKSSVGKALASMLDFIYVDTGAIYRTLGLYCYRKGIKCKIAEEVASILDEVNIEIEYDNDGLQHMLLNGEDVSSAIRAPEISICASDVSKHPVVREFLLEKQRRFASNYNVIMDGRDIGTVVLPNADVKIFLTAFAEERAKRRLLELQSKNIDCSFEDVLRDIQYRDSQDCKRAVAPLRAADDAFILDSSNIDFSSTVNALYTYVVGKLVTSEET